MAHFERIGRRTFLAQLGKTGLAIAVLGTAACASDTDDGAGAGGDATPTAGTGGAAAGGRADWKRVSLGFVSAYVLVRSGEAAVVDTGTDGSADAIETALTDAGVAWGDVGHVIVTHKHPDHAGSLSDVLTRASGATAYAGEADIPAITAPRDVTAAADGSTIFGLTIVATPGHTPGHIAVHDPGASVFVAGDSLVTSGGKAALPPANFTEDMDTAKVSAAKIAALRFETLLVGHGDPIESGAAAQVAALTEG